MNINTLLVNLQAYGTPEGLHKAWESRPRAQERPRPNLLESRYLSLELRNTPHPHVFENSDRTSWHWSADKNSLVVETVDEVDTDELPNALGMGIKTTYTIPRRNITYWGPEQESPIYLKRKGMEPSGEYKTGFMMGMKAEGTSEGAEKGWEGRERKQGPMTEKRVAASWWNRLTPGRRAAEIKLAEMRNQRIVPYGKG